SNHQRVNGLLTVLAMYQQLEPLHQKTPHHLGSTVRWLTFWNLGQNIPSGFVHPTRSRQLIPFDAISVWNQVGKRHKSVVGMGCVDVHPDMKLPFLDLNGRPRLLDRCDLEGGRRRNLSEPHNHREEQVHHRTLSVYSISAAIEGSAHRDTILI